jgi:hypothetical protein
MGDKKTFRIPVSNGLLEHCNQMGEAIWLFLWYIDKTTKEKADDSGDTGGAVLGGMPIRDSDAASALGREVKTIRRWRAHLTKAGYIDTKRTPVGYSIKVRKSKKWVKNQNKGADINVQSPEQSGQKCPISSESERTNLGVERTFLGVECPKRELHIDSTETLQGQDNKREKENRSPSLSDSSGQELTDADFVVAVAVEANEDAAFSAKAKAEIQSIIQEKSITRAELKPMVRRTVEAFNHFQLQNAGSGIAAVLAGKTVARRKKKEKQKREDEMLASMRVVLPETVRRPEAQSCPTCFDGSCERCQGREAVAV